MRLTTSEFEIQAVCHVHCEQAQDDFTQQCIHQLWCRSHTYDAALAVIGVYLQVNPTALQLRRSGDLWLGMI